MLLNPLADREQLALTPSMAHGLSFDAEMELRALGCQMIQQIGVLLRLPQRTMASAQVFFQRFWYTSSMCDFSASEIAIGTLLLSTKLEETQVRLRHLLNAYHYVLFRLTTGSSQTQGKGKERIVSSIDQSLSSQSVSTTSHTSSYQPLGYDSAEFYRLRDAVVVAEMQVLKRLGFHIQVVLPHALLANYLRVLCLTDRNLKITVRPHSSHYRSPSAPSIEDTYAERVSLAQAAWSFLNDA